MPGRVFFGTRIVNAGSGEALLFDDATFRSEFGRSFDFTRDVIVAMNGDGSANGGYINSAVYYSSSKNIWVGGSDINPGSLRVGYVVLLGD